MSIPFFDFFAFADETSGFRQGFREILIDEGEGLFDFSGDGFVPLGRPVFPDEIDRLLPIGSGTVLRLGFFEIAAA